jgi:hypothetical protein
MVQLTEEILNKIKKDHWYIFNELQRKDALLLAQEMEKESYGLRTTNPGLYHDWINYVAQLKWVAFPLMQKNEDMAALVQNYFLEGAANPDLNLIEIVTQKGELLFGVGSREFLAAVLSALRANSQEIGKEPIMIKGETALLRPAIKNWLIDYLRTVPAKNPTDMDKSSYLFKSPNAKKLNDADKKTLSKVLEFYDTFKYIIDQIAMAEMQEMVPTQPVEEQKPNTQSPRPQYQQSQPAVPATPKSMPARQQQPEPQAMAGGHAPRPIQTAPQNPYLEPISDTDYTRNKNKLNTDKLNPRFPFSDSQLPITNYQPLPQQPQSTPAQQLNHSSPQSLNHSPDNFDHLRQAPPQFNPFRRDTDSPRIENKLNTDYTNKFNAQLPVTSYQPPQSPPLQSPQPLPPQPPRNPIAQQSSQPSPPAQSPQPQQHADAIKNYYDQLARQVPPAPSNAGQNVKPLDQPRSQPLPQPTIPPQPPLAIRPRPIPDSIRSRPAAQSENTQQRNNYLEPIEESDLPRKPASQRPPDDRIMRNIIDLKNLDNK